MGNSWSIPERRNDSGRTGHVITLEIPACATLGVAHSKVWLVRGPDSTDHRKAEVQIS